MIRTEKQIIIIVLNAFFWWPPSIILLFLHGQITCLFIDFFMCDFGSVKERLLCFSIILCWWRQHFIMIIIFLCLISAMTFQHFLLLQPWYFTKKILIFSFTCFSIFIWFWRAWNEVNNSLSMLAFCPSRIELEIIYWILLEPYPHHAL